MTDEISKKTKLYKFLKNGNSSKDKVKFDPLIWQEAIRKLSELNKAEYFFDLEDRLIEEIVNIILKSPKGKAKKEVLKICEIVQKNLDHEPYVRPLLLSIQNSIKGAVGMALNCLS